MGEGSKGREKGTKEIKKNKKMVSRLIIERTISRFADNNFLSSQLKHYSNILLNTYTEAWQ